PGLAFAGELQGGVDPAVTGLDREHLAGALVELHGRGADDQRGEVVPVRTDLGVGRPGAVVAHHDGDAGGERHLESRDRYVLPPPAREVAAPTPARGPGPWRAVRCHRPGRRRWPARRRAGREGSGRGIAWGPPGQSSRPRTWSIGSAWTVLPARPVMVSAWKSALRMASSVASMVAPNRGDMASLRSTVACRSGSPASCGMRTDGSEEKAIT